MMFSKDSGRALAWLMFIQVILTTVLLGFALVQSSNESRRAKDQADVNRRVMGFLCVELEQHRAETEPGAPGVDACKNLPVHPPED